MQGYGQETTERVSWLNPEPKGGRALATALSALIPNARHTAQVQLPCRRKIEKAIEQEEEPK